MRGQLVGARPLGGGKLSLVVVGRQVDEVARRRAAARRAAILQLVSERVRGRLGGVDGAAAASAAHGAGRSAGWCSEVHFDVAGELSSGYVLIAHGTGWRHSHSAQSSRGNGRSGGSSVSTPDGRCRYLRSVERSFKGVKKFENC